MHEYHHNIIPFQCSRRQKEKQAKKRSSEDDGRKKKISDPKKGTHGLCFFSRICTQSMSVAPFPSLDEARRKKGIEAHMKEKEKRTSWGKKKGIMARNKLKGSGPRKAH